MVDILCGIGRLKIIFVSWSREELAANNLEVCRSMRFNFARFLLCMRGLIELKCTTGCVAVKTTRGT